MARTVDEKVKYNKAKGDDDFGSGYCIGVTVYRNYIKQNDSRRQQIKLTIDNFMKLAKAGDKLSKGVIAGYRDAANERKSRKTSLP